MLKKISPVLILEITVVATVFLSGFLIFAYERKNHNLNYNKSWTAVYFTDSYSPEKGIKVENHLGINNTFSFCLIPDSNNLTEPNDLSCDLSTALFKENKTVLEGQTALFTYAMPKDQGKYWLLVTYKDKSGIDQKRSLSFNN